MLFFVCLAWAAMGGALIFGGLSQYVRYYWPDRVLLWRLCPVVLACLSAGITVALFEAATDASIKGSERVWGTTFFAVICSVQSLVGALLGLSDVPTTPRPPVPPPAVWKPLDDRYGRPGGRDGSR